MEWQFTIDEMAAVAKQFWQVSGSSKVFAFHGNMGVGKTTFIHALCDAKKVSSTVGSPTFSLINQYDYKGGIIYHIDLYRVKDEEEALRAGIEDSLYSGELCLVEWPDRAPGIFPDDTLHAYFEVIDARTRCLRIMDK